MWLLLQLLWAVAFAVPVAPLVPAMLRRRPAFIEWAALTAAGAYCLAMLVGWFVLRCELAQRGVLACLVVACVPGALLVIRDRRAPRAAGERTPRWVVVTVVLGVVASLWPRAVYQLVVGDWPAGGDGLFHMAYVNAALLQHQIPTTLAPVEGWTLNYPWGSHLAVIAQAALSGAPAHVAFVAHNSLVVSVFSFLAVLLFTHRWTGDFRMAVAGMLAYANLAHFGSSDYMVWGGLPNHAGMALFVAAFALLTPRAKRAEHVIGVVLLGASFLVHHHVMITAIGVLGVHQLILAVTTRSVRPLLWFVGDVAGAVLVAAPVTFATLAKIGQLRDGGITRYTEPFEWARAWVDTPGVPLLLLCAFGLMRVRSDRRGSGLAPASFLAGTVLLFGIFGGAWRVFMLATAGTPWSAFTPSRFLTDAAYPAGALAGICLARALEGRRLVVSVLLCLVFVPAGLAEQWLWLRGRGAEGVPGQGVVAALKEIAPHLPADALVIADVAPGALASCLLACECHDTFHPVSEPPWPRGDLKRRFAQGVVAGHADEALRRELVGVRPVFVVSERALPAGVAEVGQVGPLHVGRLTP